MDTDFLDSLSEAALFDPVAPHTIRIHLTRYNITYIPSSLWHLLLLPTICVNFAILEQFIYCILLVNVQVYFEMHWKMFRKV